MLNGFINLYKSPQMTSNRALSILKKALKENNIATKVGHFGTLDPMAEGVLPVALGRATRLFDYSLDKIKKYRATFQFGIATDTLDITGKVTSEGRKDVAEEEVLSVLPALIGEVMQVPPAFSAKSIGGQRAYKLARKGEEFFIAPKKVTIYSIDLLEKTPADNFVFDITCGGGTYIRSIVRDMAELLGTVGIMTKLIRFSSGKFDIANSINIEKLPDDLSDIILPMDYLLDDFDPYYIEGNRYFKVNNGLFVPLLEGESFEKKYVKIFAPDKTLMGIGEIKDDTIGMKTWLI